MGLYIKNVLVAVTVLSFITPVANAQNYPHPGAKNCPQIAGPSGSTADQQCENDFKAKLDAHNAELERNKAAANAKKSEASSTDLLSQIEQQNLAGQSKQKNYQTAFQITSMLMMAKFYATCSSCSGGCCQYRYMAASVLAGQNAAPATSDKTSGFRAVACWRAPREPRTCRM